MGAITSGLRLKRVLVRPTVNSLENPFEKFEKTCATTWLDFSVRSKPFDVKANVPSDREKSKPFWSL